MNPDERTVDWIPAGDLNPGDLDGFSIFANLDSLRRYEQGVISDDDKRFHSLVTNDLDQDPEVTAWLETLSDTQKAELGL